MGRFYIKNPGCIAMLGQPFKPEYCLSLKYVLISKMFQLALPYRHERL